MFVDSPLEGGGFEPLVPRRRPSCESASSQDPGGFLRYPFNPSLRIHCTVGPRLAAIGTPPRTRICKPAEIPGLSAGSAWFAADRAHIRGLSTRALRPPLGVEPCPQAKTRRLGGMATPAVLPAAHSTAPLLHRSSL